MRKEGQEAKEMKHRIWGGTALICLSLLTLLSGCKAEDDIQPAPTPKSSSPAVVVNHELVPPEHVIKVSGYGEVIAAPDFATITLTVQGTADTAEQASAKCEGNLASVYDVALSLGVLRANITNAGANITAIQREADGAITGYNAVDVITIIAYDVSTANSVMSGILDASVSELKSVTYSLTDSSAAYQGALAAAIMDARQKAETIAASAGVTLGNVINVEESTNAESDLVGATFESSAIAVPAIVSVQFLIPG